ncbi:lipase family protein [Aetokthonos hydrillicola Thurmond2011]|jgi:hypothetical protein|uniref:Lipase family protein n=1 Tax=Aetokthonos hydrillicola Thurmond2011 TaxID=2712845 RepID=A0AAP5IE49_9CYAN|nr:lipase family protein [Aetokthonos hydrillicola]MBO3457952.1 lipase family protein [Aetokthonos hydrillicola CCALA 1050]MBW4587442.1 lipase family protein [Aetokthonos hydrillicola CCALA 1050]MDR9900010.1 lipase family protein [Aetokthonos hydrillicola Thurmond2011]
MYEEIIYLLDLCIFSYHLHAQTLIWPMDPYYEELLYYSNRGSAPEVTARRKNFMDGVRSNFKAPNTNETVPPGQNLPSHIYRGPGSLYGENNGWNNNNTLEPIISDYRRIYPWRPTFTRPDKNNEPWIVYNTPEIITNRIQEVWMMRYSTAAGPNGNQPNVVGENNALYNQRPENINTRTVATDWLYCFEGGTGAIAKQDAPTYPLWSMMGFALAVRTLDANGNLLFYDLYIVFRGSRSGRLRPKEAMIQEIGNPDWVTDLDSTGIAVTARVSDPNISSVGELNRGFATSINTMFPTIMRCLTEIQRRNDRAPRNIYVTGHSLGAALATLFSSSIKLGQYNPTGDNTQLPATIRNWPWNQMKLTTYASPTVGTTAFCDEFNRRMQNCVRVALITDVITAGFNHVGTRYEIKINTKDALGPKKAHDPQFIRQRLILDIRERPQGLRLLVTVPSNTGEIIGEKALFDPWKTFTTSRAVLEHLSNVYLSGNLGDCLFEFNSNFLIYMMLLRKPVFLDQPITARELQIIEDKIKVKGSFNNNNKLTEILMTLDESLKEITEGDNLRKFVGIGIILFYISENRIALDSILSNKFVQKYLETVY